jgi:anti-sigma factor RsiW
MIDDPCASMHLLIQADHDGELDAAEAARVAAHLQTCAACTAQAAALRRLSAQLRAELRPAVLPPRLQATVVRLSAPPRVAPWRTMRRQSPGFAVGLALAACLALVVLPRQPADLADEAVTAHIRALQPGHLTDVQISDQHQVKPWFDGKIDFAPPVKELSDQGFDLVGGRLDYIDGKEAAVVVYRRKLHMIDLFVTRASHDAAHPDSSPAPRTTPSGYNIERWSDGGQDYWAVSDLNRNELGDFAKAWLGR